MSVFRNLHCLSLVVCSNTTLLKVPNVVFPFLQILRFEIGCAAYLWMRLIHRRLRYELIIAVVNKFTTNSYCKRRF